MINAYFVSLNEMSIKKTEEADGEIKMLIKDSDITYNPKGKGHIRDKSYHRLMTSSNNIIPIKSKKDDRRNMIVRCSDELIVMSKNDKGDTIINEENREYFIYINKLIDDDRVIKAFYMCLINIPGLETFHTKPCPTTEYQKLIQDGNINPVEMFMKYFVGENWYNDTKEISAKDMLNSFKNWRDANNIKYDTDSAKLMRAIGIEMIHYPEGSRLTEKDDKTLHKAKGNLTRFNITKMKTHLKLFVAPEVEVDDEVEEIDH
jgi:hypothetical protein